MFSAKMNSTYCITNHKINYYSSNINTLYTALSNIGHQTVFAQNPFSYEKCIIEFKITHNYDSYLLNDGVHSTPTTVRQNSYLLFPFLN